MTNAIVGQALTSQQYQAMQSPVLALPDPEEWFEFQLKRIREAEIMVTNEERAGLHAHVPKSAGFFLVVPKAPPFSDFPRVLKHLSKVIDNGGVQEPRMDVLEELEIADRKPNDENYIAELTGAHLLLRCNDGGTDLRMSASNHMNRVVGRQSVPYTLWQAMMHVLMYPALLQQFQVMALKNVGSSKMAQKKVSPVLLTTAGPLQIVIRTWNDPVANCIFPTYGELKSWK